MMLRLVASALWAEASKMKYQLDKDNQFKKESISNEGKKKPEVKYMTSGF